MHYKPSENDYEKLAGQLEVFYGYAGHSIYPHSCIVWLGLSRLNFFSISIYAALFLLLVLGSCSSRVFSLCSVLAGCNFVLHIGLFIIIENMFLFLVLHFYKFLYYHILLYLIFIVKLFDFSWHIRIYEVFTRETLLLPS